MPRRFFSGEKAVNEEKAYEKGGGSLGEGPEKADILKKAAEENDCGLCFSFSDTD